MSPLRASAALVCFLCLAVPAPAEEAAPALDSENKKILYVLGQSIARQLTPFELSEEELAVVWSGLNDGVRNAEPKVDLASYGARIGTLAQERMAAAAEREKAAGKTFFASMAQTAGAVTTESGALYIEETAGSGASPEPTSRVTVHYHGTIRDGEVFDSSKERGEPASFSVNGVVPCFRDGLLAMKVGGKAKLVCPPESAYGDRGSPPKIPGGATLVFEVELLGIEGGDETPAGGESGS